MENTKLQPQLVSKGPLAVRLLRWTSDGGSKKNKIDVWSGKVIRVGTLGLILGVLLSATVIFLPLGLVLAATGAAAVILGICGELVADFAIWVKRRRFQPKFASFPDLESAKPGFSKQGAVQDAEGGTCIEKQVTEDELKRMSAYADFINSLDLDDFGKPRF